MINIKKKINNNKLLFTNINTCHIFLHTVFLISGFLWLDGSNLYSMIFISCLGLALHFYLLRWSFKNKIYEADMLFESSSSRLYLKFLGVSLLLSIRPLFYYFVLAGFIIVFIYLNSLTDADYEQHPWFYILIWVVIIACSIAMIGVGGLLYIFTTLTSKEHLKITDRNQFIELFNLDVNLTTFCSTANELVGFISDGFVFFKDKGLMYNGELYNQEQVIHYLKIADIKLTELDDDHIKIITMYNY